MSEFNLCHHPHETSWTSTTPPDNTPSKKYFKCINIFHPVKMQTKRITLSENHHEILFCSLCFECIRVFHWKMNRQRRPFKCLGGWYRPFFNIIRAWLRSRRPGFDDRDTPTAQNWIVGCEVRTALCSGKGVPTHRTSSQSTMLSTEEW